MSSSNWQVLDRYALLKYNTFLLFYALCYIAAATAIANVNFALGALQALTHLIFMTSCSSILKTRKSES